MLKKPTSGFLLFSIISLVVMVGIAFLLSYLTSIPLKKNVLDQAVVEASSTSLLVARQLTPQDIATPMAGQRLQAFDSFIKEHLVSSHLARVRLWNKESVIIYSDDFSTIGKAFPDNIALRDSLKGVRSRDIHTPQKSDNANEQKLGTLIEVYVPLRFSGSSEIHGAVEIYEYYALYKELIQQQQKIVFGANLLGLLVLYGVLTVIARSVWAQTKRQRLLLEQKEAEVKKATEENLKILNEQTRLQEGVEHQKERLAHLGLAMTIAQGTPGAIEMGKQLLGLIQKEVGAEYASLTLINPDGTLGERLDLFHGMAAFPVTSRAGGITEAVLTTGKTQYITNSWEDTRSNPALVAAGIRSYLGISMRLEGQLIGIMFFHSTKPDAFREDKLFLESFANICAIPLQRARLLLQVEQAKEELEATFDAVPTYVVLIDDNKQVLRANAAFARLVGQPVFRVVGISICTLIHGKDERLHRCPIEKSISDTEGEVVAFREPHLANAQLQVRTYHVASSPDKPRRYVQFYSVVGY